MMMAGMGRPTGSQSGALEEDVFGSPVSFRVLSRLWPYVLPHKGLVTAAAVSVLAFAATLVAVPWLIKVGIDDYIRVGDFPGLTLVVGILSGIALLNAVADFAQEVTIARAGQGVLYGLRRDLFAHLQKQSLSFYDKTETGRIMSRVQGDVFQLHEFLSVVVVTLADLLSLVGYVVMLLVLSLKLGLISMVVLPVLVLLMAVWQPFAVKSFLRVRRAISIVNGALNENITGVRVVQGMNRQGRNLEEFDAKNQENFDANLFASRLSAGVLPGVDILNSASIGLAIFFGARMVSDATLEVGALIAFILYIQRFFDPIRSLTMQYTQLQRAMASGMRVFDLLDTKPELTDAPGAKEMPRLRGEIEFRDVSYSYVPGQDVIKNVNLHIKPGQTVAIVGPTGAGKTTLVSLVARFYDVPRDRGAILVDGHDIRDETRRSLARQMSMVLQEPFLFSGTVMENIKYNRTEATDEHAMESAKAVGAHDFIMKLEDGYDTYLHERGVNLSVGQRQLLSFARAIIADPRILVLDEATANIDSYTEMLIQRALQTLLQGRTAIVIAHRLSTIRRADKIVVMDHGEAVEEGTHPSLMERGGLYAHLYHMNFAALKETLPLSSNGAEGSDP